MIKVLVVDDHKVFSDGIKAIMEDVKDISFVGAASNGREMYAHIDKQMPDVILMDISLESESGIDLTKSIKETHPNIKILILSMHSESGYIVKALEAGATGYILKDAGSIEMMTAIRTVYNGDTYYSKQVSSVLVQHFTQGTNPKNAGSAVALTPREIEILKLIAEEYSNPEIAKQLFISIRTVDTHRRNLLEKLQVKNTAGLVKYAVKHSIVDLDQ